MSISFCPTYISRIFPSALSIDVNAALCEPPLPDPRSSASAPLGASPVSVGTQRWMVKCKYCDKFTADHCFRRSFLLPASSHALPIFTRPVNSGNRLFQTCDDHYWILVFQRRKCELSPYFLLRHVVILTSLALSAVQEPI